MAIESIKILKESYMENSKIKIRRLDGHENIISLETYFKVNATVTLQTKYIKKSEIIHLCSDLASEEDKYPPYQKTHIYPTLRANLIIFLSLSYSYFFFKKKNSFLLKFNKFCYIFSKRNVNIFIYFYFSYFQIPSGLLIKSVVGFTQNSNMRV